MDRKEEENIEPKEGILQRVARAGTEFVSSLWENCFDHLEQLIPESAQVYKIERLESEVRYLFSNPIKSEKDPCKWELYLFILMDFREYQRRFSQESSFYPSRIFSKDLYALKSPSRVRTVFVCSSAPPDFNEFQPNSKTPFYLLCTPMDFEQFDQKFREKYCLVPSSENYIPAWLQTKHQSAYVWMCALGLIYSTQAFSDSGMPAGMDLAGVNLFNLVNQDYFYLFAGPFLHGGIAHLVFNLTSILFLWSLLSRMCSAVFLNILFVVSMIYGMIYSLCFVNGTSIGISGAVYGLVGALCFGLWKARSGAVENQLYCIQKLYLQRMLKSLLIFSFLLPVLIPRIDIHGHLGGLLGGYFFTWLVWSCFRYRELSSTVSKIIAVSALIGTFLFPAMYLNVRIQKFNDLRKQHEFAKLQSLQVKEFFNNRVIPFKLHLKGVVQLKLKQGEMSSKEQKVVRATVVTSLEKMKNDPLSSQEELISQYIAVLQSGHQMIWESSLSELKRNYEGFELAVEKMEEKILKKFSLIREKSKQGY